MAVTIPTPTKNAVPSADIKDVVFAGAKIDEFATSTNHYYIDRLGVQRFTASGLIYYYGVKFQQAIANSGYTVIGRYEDGVQTLSNYNEIVEYNGEFYKLKPGIIPPFTTTGTTSATWGNDSASLVSVGDAALRQDLASEDPINPGASFVHVSQRGTVQDAIGKVVTLESFGVYLQSADIIKSGAAIDMSDKFQAAVNHAKELGTKLVCTQGVAVGPSANYFIYIEKDIDITGLLETVGTFCFGYLASKFTPRFATADNPVRYPVLRNMNAKYDSATGKQYFSTTSGYQRFDAIQVSCLDGSPPDSYINQLHTTAYTHFRGDIVGRKGATAIRFANCYDCSFSGQIYAIDSGTIDYYPFEVGSYPAFDKADESNAMTLPNVILHTNKYRDASIIGSKINLTRVHCEALTIPRIDELVPNNIDKLTPTGIASFVFGSVGGYAGNIDIMPDDSSPVIGTCLINTMNTEVGTIHGSSKIHIQVSDVFYLGMGGSSSSIYTVGDVTLDGGAAVHVDKLISKGNLNASNASAVIEYANVAGTVLNNSSKINKLVCGGNYSQNQYGELHGGLITGSATLNGSSKIFDTVFNGPFTNISANGRLVRCAFNGTFSNTGVGNFDWCNLPSSFLLEDGNYYKCSIPTTLSAKSSAKVKGTLERCSISAIAITNNNNAAVYLRGCDVGATKQPDLSNNTGFVLLDDSCKFTGDSTSIKGWSQPASTSPGYGSETINPFTGTGWRLVYNGTTPYWASVKKYT